MRSLGIIPARGGSKGVPRKNVRPLAGKPLICHSIAAAQASTRLSSFLVSTDDEEIAQAAKAAGAPVLPRPAEFAQDATSMPEVIRHVLAERGEGIDLLVLLQPTCPQRTGEDIDRVIAMFDQPDILSVISVYQVEDHHPARMYRTENERLVALFPEDMGKRRQELPPVYHRNGAIYACRVPFFEASGALWDSRPAPYLMPRERSLNIDDPLDFEWAEFLYSKAR